MSDEAVPRPGEPAAAATQRARQLGSFAALLAGGRRLGTAERALLEPVLRRDLGELVIHDTEQAERLTRRLGAGAFAVGRRIFAPPGVGQNLLAHEAAHVVQQTAPPLVPRLPLVPPGAGRSVSGGGRPAVQLQTAAEPQGTTGREAAAERTAEAVAAQRPSTGPAAEIDLEALADRVYALLCEQAVLETERLAGPF